MNLRNIVDRDKKDKGVGDTVARVTSRLGVRPCSGCKKRQEALNKKLPYKEGDGNEQR